MQPLTIWVVDAFTSAPFCGNQAGVCVVSKYDEEMCQQIAAEMNYAETAFLVPINSQSSDPSRPRTNSWFLRWWTPAKEVKLCGHATLASAHALFSNNFVANNAEPILFQTKYSGQLRVSPSSSAESADMPLKYIMNFPALPYSKSLNNVSTYMTEVVACLGLPNKQTVINIVESGEDLLVELRTENIELIEPKFGLMKKGILSKYRCVIITTSEQQKQGSRTSRASRANKSFDFVSRVFAPMYGVDEDPVTGSAHCGLIVYWTDKLKKYQKCLNAYQASPRGGHVVVKWDTQNGRVLLNGNAVTTLKCHACLSPKLLSRL